MRISVFCLAVNVGFAALFLLGLQLGAAGLALANSLSSMTNFGLLLYALKRKLGRLDLEPLRAQLAATLGAAVVAGVGAWAAWHGWELWLGHEGIWQRIGAAFLPMLIATVGYGLLCRWAGVTAALEIQRAILGRIFRK